MLSNNIIDKFGNVLEGDFNENEILIKDKIIYKNGIVLEGEFESGEFVKGTKMYNDILYEGKFKKNKLIEGKITYKNGDIHEGRYENEKLYEGKKIFANGKIEEGNFDYDGKVNNTVMLEELIDFLDNNADKLHIPENEQGTYSISDEQVQKVIDNIKNHSGFSQQDQEDCVEFLKRLVEIFIYIPFDRYIRKISAVTLEIMLFLLNNHHKYEVIYYVINDNITKSNTWVALLFFNALKNFLISPMNEAIKNKFKFWDMLPTSREGEHNKKVLILIFDDMSYSGQQMALTINDENKCINFDVYVTTPYISKTAINKIHEKNKKILFWKNTTVVESIHDLFTNFGTIEKYNNLFNKFCIRRYDSRDNIFLGFQCNSDMIPIYFDHKIADSFSTFQKLLMFGLYPINKNGPNECIMSSLIKKCEKNEEEKSILLTKYKCDKYVLDIPLIDTCPKTFYKTFNYVLPYVVNDSTYNNNTLFYLLKHQENS